MDEVDPIVVPTATQLDRDARALVLMVRMRPGVATRDEESVAVALHGRGIVTFEACLLAAGNAGTGSAALTPQLAERLGRALARLPQRLGAERRPLGLCAGREAAAAVLALAAQQPALVHALALLGGDLDLCQAELERVRAPTLMVVGPGEFDTVGSNRRACRRLGALARLDLLVEEGHVFAASGLGTRRAELVAEWFDRHLARPVGARGLPFDAAGPGGSSAGHLADVLAPRHSEADGTS